MKVIVEIDSKWQRIVRSLLMYFVYAFQGVAITFAPLFLYQCGKGMWLGYERVIMPILFCPDLSGADVLLRAWAGRD